MKATSFLSEFPFPSTIHKMQNGRQEILPPVFL